jgi:hypothetical protein
VAAVRQMNGMDIGLPPGLVYSGVVAGVSVVAIMAQADRLDQAEAMAELAAKWDRRLAMIKRLDETAHAENNKKRSRHDR